MRVHNFDGGFETAAPASGAPAGEREMVPDGTHGFTIREASEGPHRFPDNYPGEYLHLTLAPNGPYGFVWVSLGVGEKDQALAASLATALGYTAHDWADAEPEQLKGKEVRATTRQVTSKAGRTRAYVNAFLPAEEEKPKKPAARTPAAKVAAARGEEAGGDGDIPF